MSHDSVMVNSHIRRCLSEHPLEDKNPADMSVSTLHGSSASDETLCKPQFEVVSKPSFLPMRRRPLDPPPPCFSTLSPLRIRSRDFPPFLIPTVTPSLTDGFRPLYPSNVLEKHGITRADWIRFLEDLGIAARLSSEGGSAVGSRVPITPLITHRALPSRAFGAVYDGKFARSPLQEVLALIQIWNECAFQRRKISVSLQVHPTDSNGREYYALLVESL
ncbi:hypothetical protein JVU11DRAFT_8192 [Chiua virens]|nr:hypothetical protein JVU11DRAFT_8192 [Chiua virens]